MTIPVEDEERGDYTWTCSSSSGSNSSPTYKGIVETSTFGDSTSLFGGAFTSDDLNSPEFGISFSVAGGSLVKVHDIRVKFHYLMPEDFGTLPDVQDGLIAVTQDGPLTVAVGQGGLIITSPDSGANWTQRVSGVGDDLYSVAYGNGIYVATGQGGTILNSSDGVTWLFVTSPTNQHLYGLIFSRGKFITVGSNQDCLLGASPSLFKRSATKHNPYSLPT